MAKHYNLYYLFLEDMPKHPLSEERSQQIRQNIENFYRQEKPPDKAKPP